MSKVYLVNVGANTSHGSKARSPLFDDGSFEYVPFPVDGREDIAGCVRRYPDNVRQFVRGPDRLTHPDPDWTNLTYGDDCSNGRAAALRRVIENDILLFWALLWRNSGRGWSGFCDEKHWCLIGALRVREILKPGSRPEDADPCHVARASNNVHFARGQLQETHRVFIGCAQHSCRFQKAVDLQVESCEGLLYRTIRAANGAPLTPGGSPLWYSSIRGCRVIWNLDDADGHSRAWNARDAILHQTGFDVLKGL